MLNGQETAYATRAIDALNELLANSRRSQPQQLVSDLTRQEADSFSIVRAAAAAATGDWTKAGFESEVSTTLEKKCGLTRHGPRSFFMPTGLPFVVKGQRSRLTRSIYQVGTASQGGNLVETKLDGEDFIDVLRNAMVTGQLGATYLPGLTGNLDLPRQASQSNAFWVGESGALTESEATFDKVSLRPHTVGAMSKISRLMQIQATPAVEQLIRDDLTQVLALEEDRVALLGTGSGNQPTGIANTSGVGAVVGGTNGANASFDLMTALYSTPLTANAPQANLGYALNAKTKGYLASLKATTGQYLWNPGGSVASSIPQSLLGYSYAMSNQLPYTLSKGVGSINAPYNAGSAYTPGQCVSSGGVIYVCTANTTGNAPPNGTYWSVAPGSVGICSMAVFGNWKELIFGEWGVIEVLVNPFDSTGFANGDVIIRALHTVDVGVRHPASFAVISDLLTPGF